jgi:hypothetical protein
VAEHGPRPDAWVGHVANAIVSWIMSNRLDRSYGGPDAGTTSCVRRWCLAPDLDSFAVAAGETEEGGAATAPEAAPGRKRWYQRPTIRARKEEAERGSSITRALDDRENDETRLPSGEEVHLGGLAMMEAFTPSTVSSLYDVLEHWPARRAVQRRDWIEQLERSRGGAHGGWQSLGVVRPRGAFIIGEGVHDPDLPDGVDAVWLHLSYVTPALAMIVATFTLSESAGELSDLLRQDYQTEHDDVRIRVYGRLGKLRANIPWARPARHGVSYSIRHPEDLKRRACLALIRGHEDGCGRWFARKFPGRLSADPEDRPVIRLVFTREQVPYAQRLPWLRPIGLDFALPIWRSVRPAGWWLAENRWPYEDRRYALTLAARRSDAAREPTAERDQGSNWYLTQRFGDDYAPLVARYGISALMSLYARELGQLRDRAGVRRFPKRPVQQARELDNYLARDGLDASTVAADLEALTSDLPRFRWNVPEFLEVLEVLPEPRRIRQSDEFVPSLCRRIRDQALRLASDTEKTIGNIRASAELRQAIANTRLQRVLLILSLAAIIIAVVSLVVAKH